MKIGALVLVAAVAITATAHAAISTGETNRLHESADVLRSIRSMPDKGIPDDLWNRAACVAAIPNVKKAAFIFGGEYGKGVITCRVGQSWSAPAFIQLEKGSWGFQVGAEEVDLVLLVMSQSGAEKLMHDKVSLGGAASVAAGPVGRSATASTDIQMHAEILSYSRAHGLFAGLDLSGGVLGPDRDANTDVYGANQSVQSILTSARLKAPRAADTFMAAIRAEARPVATTGQR